MMTRCYRVGWTCARSSRAPKLGRKPVEYSDHARRRMVQRKITESDVEAALRRKVREPEAGDNGNKVVFGYAPGQRILKVVLTADGQTVVSVMAVGE